MKAYGRKARVLLLLCLLLAALALPTFAVIQRIVLVGAQETYTLGETLQLQARLVPDQDAVQWVWCCRMPGAEEEIAVGQDGKLMLDLTAAHHGAVLRPMATLADGTVVAGPEKTLTVEVWYTGLELEAAPEKTAYRPGEIFASAGVQVFALRGDGSREDVTDRCSFSPETMELGVTEVLAVCQLRQQNGEIGDFCCSIPVTVTAPTSKPDKPDKPAEPDKPVEPDKPAEPDKPDDTKQPDDVGGSDKTEETPNWSGPRKTEGVVWLCIGAVAVAGAALIGVLLWRKAGKETEKKDDAP